MTTAQAPAEVPARVVLGLVFANYNLWLLCFTGARAETHIYADI